MSRSNRTLNRVLLVLVAALWLGLAAAVALVAWPDRLGELAGAVGLTVDVPQLSVPTTPLALQIVVAAAAVLVVLALVWTLTRGRGGTPTAYREEAAEVSIGAVRDIVRDRLEHHPDVLGLRIDASRLRGGTILLVKAEVRRAADLARLRRDLDAALADLDEILGAELPILIHLTDGIRSRLQADRTVS
jgi:hypothetical protein